MKALYYDCFSGISGDMNLAAMIDLGVPVEYLLTELRKLKISGFELRYTDKSVNGMNGTRIDVITEHEHAHRNLSVINEIIDQSEVSDAVKHLSKNMFLHLAEAEATVHNQNINEIHFHEVGAIDAIVDIVGAAICYDYLKPEIIISSAPELGGGTVKCAHGILPVPAPATVEILKGIPVNSGNQDFECTTPTGATILASNADIFEPLHNFTIQQTGYGIGHKESKRPNVLRVFLGEYIPDQEAMSQHYIIECNIDDQNPEITAHMMETLLAIGADDVFFTPIQMKKNRPAIKLSVLAHANAREKVVETLLKESSSFGLRYYAVTKKELERSFIQLETKFGTISIKQAFLKGEEVKSKPEFDDVKRAAEEYGVPVREVYLEIQKLGY